ncbi:hypothetical protein BCR32DRAFT_16656 [Anaeromyces robustus]|uniref:Mitochondrial distribution and morphology protein 12 n=1 Tax=Anaeromyces robustus TaxID=1754192 RepID=A0A1Y1X576_9FUNG|nr:hypothetical protein BCR32DRAFT_162697 [Anaeromyces robustus]ORX80970.1 hypothetical protein BCR32DRAFT_16656 [Anaeromyces robustus]|eukprot:ORX38095.1 hypothetical protein BCR32DRAFT_162697 [Anaeromyces robustus]
MSFEIFWDKLDSDIALSFQNYLNDYFKEIKRPDFLGEIVFSDTDFGKIPPEITIIDICDPMPEFYDEFIGDNSNENDFINNQENCQYGDEIEKEMGEDYYISPLNEILPPRHDEWSSKFNRFSFNGFNNPLSNQNFYKTSSLQNLGQNFNALSLSDINSNNNLDFNDNTTDSSETNTSKNSNHTTENRTPEKTRSIYSDISFDFNNLTSFLMKNTIGTSVENKNETNNNNNTSSNKENNNNNDDSINNSMTSTSYHINSSIHKNILEEEEISSLDNAASTISANTESMISDNLTHEDLNDNNDNHFYNNTSLSTSSQPNSTTPSKQQQPLNLDIQVELEVVYKGNLKLTVSTELILNKPTPAFMTLPIKLALKGISFKVIAYIGKQINFCFKEPEESESLIEDIRLESELGDENKQVLKNISKIEGFLISKIKSSIDELLIFPNYHSIYISKEEEN